MKVFAVMADTAGAHESDALYSIWDSKESAEAEIQRLKKGDVNKFGFGPYGGNLYVLEVELNSSSDEELA